MNVFLIYFAKVIVEFVKEEYPAIYHVLVIFQF